MQSAKCKMQNGFTLIEIIVSLAVFSIVAVVALGALLKIISVNAKAQSIQAAVTNLNFSLESMSRELRTGSVYHCETNSNPSFGSAYLTGNSFTSQDCSTGGNVIVFQTTNTSSGVGGQCRLAAAYWFDGSAGQFILKKAEQNNCDDDLGSSAAPFAPVVSPSVTIDDYELKVVHNVSTHVFPLAFIHISGFAGVREHERTYFNVQTSVAAIP